MLNVFTRSLVYISADLFPGICRSGYLDGVPDGSGAIHFPRKWGESNSEGTYFIDSALRNKETLIWWQRSHQ